MSENKLYPLTVEGKRLLEEELKRLLTVERPDVLRAIDVARAHGDLKENAEYHAAKERQSFMEGRIQSINGMLGGAQVIDPSQLAFDHIVFGATVTMEDTNTGAEVCYKIVGIDEADIAKGKISIASPIARALIGKKPGDEVQVRTPKGNANYEVRKVEYR